METVARNASGNVLKCAGTNAVGEMSIMLVLKISIISLKSSVQLWLLRNVSSQDFFSFLKKIWSIVIFMDPVELLMVLARIRTIFSYL